MLAWFVLPRKRFSGSHFYQLYGRTLFASLSNNPHTMLPLSTLRIKVVSRNRINSRSNGSNCRDNLPNAKLISFFKGKTVGILEFFAAFIPL